MKLNRIAAAAAAATIATVAIVSGVAGTQHGTAATLSADSHSVVLHPASSHQASSHPARSHTTAPKASPADPSLAWLVSRGGQAQVTFNNDVAVLAGDLQIESSSPTVANHLIFEADARTVRTQAENILATPALQPTHNRAAYKQMLNDFITVANLLQPGPGYGTTPQDYTAWNTATQASDITVW
jgi:hypothetical protein